jgi:surfeit locus 1 family protein
MAQAPNWFAVARRPKWIGALLIALAVAAICGLLAQWQGGRSFEAGLPKISSLKTQSLSKVLQPNQSVGPDAVGSKVHVALTINPEQCYVVTGRVQRNGDPGNWVVCQGITRANVSIPVALGFAATTIDAQKAVINLKKHNAILGHYTGLLAPGEAPLERAQNLAKGGGVLHSLSVGQLVNLYSPAETIKAYPLFLLVVNQAVAGTEKITVTTATESQINWLSAFYALEWTVFCGFSVFLWWRLVKDAQIKEAAAGLGQ